MSNIFNFIFLYFSIIVKMEFILLIKICKEIEQIKESESIVAGKCPACGEHIRESEGEFILYRPQEECRVRMEPSPLIVRWALFQLLVLPNQEHIHSRFATRGAITLQCIH